MFIISAKSANILCRPSLPDCLGACTLLVEDAAERTDDDERERLCVLESIVAFVFVDGVTTGPIGNELVLLKGLEEAITV
jgi:hypothetical protein